MEGERERATETGRLGGGVKKQIDKARKNRQTDMGEDPSVVFLQGRKALWF